VDKISPKIDCVAESSGRFDRKGRLAPAPGGCGGASSAGILARARIKCAIDLACPDPRPLFALPATGRLVMLRALKNQAWQ